MDRRDLVAAVRKGLPIGKLHTSGLSMPVKDAGDRTLRFVISTADVDRDGDTIAQDGWDLSSYMANPVVLWGHDQSALPVGKATQIGLEDGCLCATVEFVPADVPVAGPIAEAVYQMCRNGFLSATSVGFMPESCVVSDDPDRGTSSYPGLDHKQQCLLEFSIVTVPSNPFALIDQSSLTETDPMTPEVVEASLDIDLAKIKRRRAIVLCAAN